MVFGLSGATERRWPLVWGRALGLVPWVSCKVSGLGLRLCWAGWLSAVFRHPSRWWPGLWVAGSLAQIRLSHSRVLSGKTRRWSGGSKSQLCLGSRRIGFLSLWGGPLRSVPFAGCRYVARRAWCFLRPGWSAGYYWECSFQCLFGGLLELPVLCPVLLLLGPLGLIENPLLSTA